MGKQTTEIRCDELAEIKSFDDGKKSFQVIRVCSWNGGDPVIEKRWFFRLPDGALKTGRASGFTLEDLTLLVTKFDKISELIKRGDGIGQKI